MFFYYSWCNLKILFSFDFLSKIDIFYLGRRINNTPSALLRGAERRGNLMTLLNHSG